MSKAKTAAKKIFSVIERPTDISAMVQPSNMIPVDLAKFEGNIEFHNVWFRYPTRKNDWVLKGLNLKINKNETIALVGESGCGKSTIVSLILRFYDVNHGSITIDGVDIRDYNLKQLRHAMSLVMQEPTLFNYSIMDNILYGEMGASNSEILEAAKIANAMEFISSQDTMSSMKRDETTQGLVNALIYNRDAVVYNVGQKLY